MQAVVLAGGLATRLGDLAKRTPKYLIEVAGRPFAHWQLERLAAAGYQEVVLCVGHLGESIQSALGPAAHGLALRYVSDGADRLGTGGALKNAEPLLETTFLVTYGDSYLPFDYAAPLRDLRDHEDAQATMAVFENRGQFDRSNTRIDGDSVIAYDKTATSGGFSHIDYGATALRRRALALLPDGPSDLSTLQHELAKRGAMRAYEVSERFYEIGSKAGLADLERHMERAGA